MNSVIICEGSTDFVLLQYYMRKVHQWEYKGAGSIQYISNKSRDLKRVNDVLTIMSAGGCSNIVPAFENVLDRNLKSQPDQSDAITKIVIITDRDEIGTEADFIIKINKALIHYNANPLATIANNSWTDIKMNTSSGIPCNFQLLLLVIPFTKKGAMETFLLDVISKGKQNIYDRQIVAKGKAFVQNADPAKKYLIHRRYITKAEFDVYFCIRTASEQFVERQNILKNIPWENYTKLQKDFRLLGDL